MPQETFRCTLEDKGRGVERKLDFWGGGHFESIGLY
jgi:hypothetical protein